MNILMKTSTLLGAVTYAGHTLRLAMLLLTMVTAVAANADEMALTLSGGTGTAADPYRISTAADIQELAAACNLYPDNSTGASRGHYAGKHFILTQTISCSDISTDYHPIGAIIALDEKDATTTTDDFYFAGHLDGQGYTIKDLSFEDDASFAGLFGALNGATIENIHFNSSVSITAHGQQGTVCGYAVNTTFRNIETGAYLTAKSSYAGGICGIAKNCTFTSCTMTQNCTVYCSGNNAGGIVGYAMNGVTITDCQVAGYVHGLTGMYCGGMLGYAVSSATTDKVTITGCMLRSTARVEGGSRLGGMVGYAQGYPWTATREYTDVNTVTIRNCQTEQGAVVYARAHTGTGGIVGTLRYGAVIGCQSSATVDGYADGTGGIVGMVSAVTTNNVVTDFSAAIIDSCTFTGTAVSERHTTASQRVGGIVGYIEECKDETLYTVVRNCENTGTVTGLCAVGGIAGFLGKYAVIQACKNHGAVTATRETLAIEGTQYLAYSCAGGLAGQMYPGSKAINSFNTAAVTGPAYGCGGITGQQYGAAQVVNCYNVAPVSGYMYVGGITGDMYGLTNIGFPVMAYCYNTGVVSCTNANLKGVGNLWGYTKAAYDTHVQNYYMDELGTQAADADSLAVPYQQMLTEDFCNRLASSSGNAYQHNLASLPLLTTHADDPYAKIYAAGYLLADGDTDDHITQPLTLSNLPGITWEASGALSIADGKAIPTSSGMGQLTVTAGSLSRSFLFVNVTVGIDAVTATPSADLPAYNLNGVRVSPSYHGIVIQGGKKIVR